MDETAPRGRLHSPRPQAERQIALEVWAFAADRNAAQTARLLAEQHDLAIPETTIRKWAVRYNWDQQATDLMRTLAPQLYDRAALLLLRAAVPAARYLLDVVEGTVVPDKVRLAAADSALNRTGFLPFSRTLAQAQADLKQREQHVTDDSTDSLAQLSDEELERLAHGVLTIVPRNGAP